MKIRAGFVSNSSSSSFIINMNVLSKEKIQDIMAYLSLTDSWSCIQTKINDESVFVGYTTIDNADSDERQVFFCELLGIMPDQYDETVRFDDIGENEFYKLSAKSKRRWQ